MKPALNTNDAAATLIRDLDAIAAAAREIKRVARAAGRGEIPMADLPRFDAYLRNMLAVAASHSIGVSQHGDDENSAEVNAVAAALVNHYAPRTIKRRA